MDIRRAEGDADLEALATLVNAVTPEDPTSVEEMRWADTTYPGTTRFLALIDERPVGVATVGRVYVHPPEHPDLWGAVVVVPQARRQGVGAALLIAISETARAAGKTGLTLRAFGDRPEGITFLEHRGFTERERARIVRLTLEGRARPAVELPQGVEVTTLAVRPELVRGVHDIALEAFPDIPGGDDPISAGDFEEFRARDVDRPGILPDAFMVAVASGTDEVVGYASLMLVPGNPTIAWHDMTAVRRTWRGHGIARALKAATIGWAIDRGLVALDTGNDVDNAPMRAVNARFGYEPMPDEILYRGPLFLGPA